MSQGKKLTTTDFINRAKIIHNYKYDYSEVLYINSKLKVKIICPIHGDFEQMANTIYEFYGDFWHGNPQIYKKEKINLANEKTINREKIILKAGYKLITIWETDFINGCKET